MDIRLKRKEDFERVFKKGKRVYSRNLTLLYIESDGLKIGYSVSKKHGCSVMRNRVKRLLRASFFNFKDEIKGNYHIVFLPKVEESYDYEDFCKSMKCLLKKSGLIK